LRAGVTALLLSQGAVTAGCGDISVQQEDELGDQYAAGILTEVTLLPDAEVSDFVTRLGRGLTGVADDAQRDWHFYVVDDTVMNAFAVPGGHVFVYRGLIEGAAAFEELAGVLGHEIAHVTLRHSIDQMKSRQKTNLIVSLVCSVVDLCASTAAQVAIGVGGQALFAKYSRDDEAEADSAAVEYLAAAGIDPQGVSSMFRRMLALRSTSPSSFQAWFGSHPIEEDRIARTEAQAARHPAVAGRGQSHAAEFTALRERLAALNR
jgi:predicted Zn-dependent protease